MVHKVIQTRAGVFVEAFIISIVIFIAGFAAAFLVENNRIQDIEESYKQYELAALDLKLQNYYYQIMDDRSCQDAIEQNFRFADDIYEKGLEIERYEEANQITSDLELEKKRYVLLKTELWLNSILLKKKCDDPFDTVVYIYEGDPKSTTVVSQQQIISNVLRSIKEDKGNSVILIPIAGDLELEAVSLQMRIYSVTYIPAIIINEEKTLYGFHEREAIEEYLD